MSRLTESWLSHSMPSRARIRARPPGARILRIKLHEPLRGEHE
ncbi:hypothetical protein [Nocardiopsis alborubida]|nr:hypothetical protein [Nocardiopsis alborubida]